MNIKITLTLTLIATLIILSAGCIENDTIPTNITVTSPIINVTPTPTIIPTIPTITPTIIPTPKPKLNRIDILLNDITENNAANKFGYGTGMGGASEYRYSYQIACEQGKYIKDNYNYTCGLVDISDKLYLYGYAQTWVIIGNTTYIIDSMSDTYWTQEDHQVEFDAVRIELFSLQKGREYAKCMAESWRTDAQVSAIPTVNLTIIPTSKSTIVPISKSMSTTESITVSTKTKSSIPDDYYNITIDQHFIDYKIYNYLDGYTWNKPLICGAGWGLPEVAELEHELTERGCNVTIRYASVTTTINHEDFKNRIETDGYARSGCLPEIDQYDTWLMIEFEGEMVAYNIYGSYWIFKPDHKSKNYYVSNDRWHSWYYYQDGNTETYNGDTWTVHDFKDFKDIYEIEEWFLSGAAQTWKIEHCVNGQWCSYYTSDNYDPADDFLIQFGWWMTEDEYHATESRINKATNWFVLLK